VTPTYRVVSPVTSVNVDVLASPGPAGGGRTTPVKEVIPMDIEVIETAVEKRGEPAII